MQFGSGWRAWDGAVEWTDSFHSRAEVDETREDVPDERGQSWCERQRPPSDEIREDVPCARRDGHARVHRVAAEEDRVAGRHLHAIREALSMQLGRRHRDGMLRVAEERAAPFEVGHVVQGDDV